MDYYYVMNFENYKVFKENNKRRIITYEKCYIFQTRFPLTELF